MAWHIDSRQMLLTPGREFTIEEAREIVNDLWDHCRIDTEDRFHNFFFHEVCPLLRIAEHAGNEMTRIVFRAKNARYDGTIILGDGRKQKVEMTAAIDGYQDALRMELLAERGRAPAFQKIRFSGNRKNRIFHDVGDAPEPIISHEYDQTTLRSLLDEALRRKLKKAQTNVNYRGAWLGIVFDDWVEPFERKKKRRFDPLCEQIIADGQYHPFSRVFIVGLSRKYIFDSFHSKRYGRNLY